jgi:hypothetical protein
MTVQTFPAWQTIHAPADRFGTLVDTGLRAGQMVDIEVGGETFRRIVLGPATQPREYIYVASQWQREIRCEPMVRVAPEGLPEFWADVPVSRISHVGERVPA